MTDREQSEQKALEAIRSWLPELVTPGARIVVEAIDPEKNDGARFHLSKARAHVCRR